MMRLSVVVSGSLYLMCRVLLPSCFVRKTENCPFDACNQFGPPIYNNCRLSVRSRVKRETNANERTNLFSSAPFVVWSRLFLLNSTFFLSGTKLTQTRRNLSSHFFLFEEVCVNSCDSFNGAFLLVSIVRR